MDGETGVDILQLQKSADQQSRSDDENKGKSDLTYYQERADLAIAKAHTGPAEILVERDGTIGARHGNCGHQAKEDAGKQRDGQGEQQDTGIESDGRAVFSDSRNIPRADAQKQTHSAESDGQAEQPATRESARLSASS